MILGEQVELFLQQDILGVDVSIDEAELRTILRVLQGSTDDLEHRRNTSTASDHSQVAGKRGRVRELSLGTLDAYFVADFEQRNIF